MSDEFEWIQWGVRQGSLTAPAQDEATATQSVRVLTKLGHPAEIAHRRVTEQPRTGTLYQTFGDWQPGAPAAGWTTVYRASSNGKDSQVFATPNEAWQHLIGTQSADGTDDPDEFTCTGTVRTPDHLSYSVAAVDIPLTE